MMHRAKIVCLLVVILAGVVSAQNLVKDPGFERAETGGVGAWGPLTAAGTNGAVARVDATQGHSGRQCLLLDQTHPLALPDGAIDAPNLVKFMGDKRVGGFVHTEQTVPVEGGRTYNFTFWYKAAGLLRENRDDLKQGYAAFQVFIYWLDNAGKRVAGTDGTLWAMNQQVDGPNWVQAVNSRAHTGPRAYLAPVGAKAAVIRFALETRAPDVTPKVWIDDVVWQDRDTAGQEVSMERKEVALVNAGFEDADGAAPKGWKPVGSAKAEWVGEPVHGGKKAVAVSDAGMGGFSGWACDVPVVSKCAYAFSGWVKGGEMNAYGQVAGGALCLQFQDKDGQPLGEPTLSRTVAAHTEWQEVSARTGTPPAGTVTLRLIVGLQYCKGTAWFDDLCLTAETQTAGTTTSVRHPNPQPSPGVAYATNLLTHGDVEEGEGNKPAGWTYVGKTEKDWKPEQIAAFHREGRPDFHIGRGRGEWSRELTYAGKGALLNISIDPPLSKNMQWYGRNPVDGFWLSDPMPCKASMAYLAGAWLRPGAVIDGPWFGPLEIQFFGEGGRRLPNRNGVVRTGIGSAPSGVWTFWATLPYVAPDGVKTMRLRFGQELCALDGGWGKTYADNLAVWELPEGVSAENTQDHNNRTEQFWAWFRQAHAKVKPPYLPSPAEAPEYQSCLGRVENGVPGNLYRDPAAEIPIKVAVSSQIGESRKVTLHIEQYDWLGNAAGAFDVPAFDVPGYSEGTTTVRLPPTRSYGAFYLQGWIKEDEATVGEFAGRYAVLPPLDRPRTVENIWGVTTLVPFFGDGRSEETEMGVVLKTAGFGVAWLNLSGTTDAAFERSRREVEWWQSLGIRPVLRINHFDIQRPIDPAYYEAFGKRIAAAFKGKVAAYGDWGVEQADHRTPDKPVYRPIIGGRMLSDEEYDIILAALHDGIKSVDKETPVLIGNIAGDTSTIPRLYGKPVGGRFDGAILNGYMGVLSFALTSLHQFDEHGDTQKTVWKEEDAEQRSPASGSARRYGEADGPKNMVRVWLSMKALCGPRLKAKTMWGFAGAAENGSDIMMVTAALQPRPHFVAHAVMADALADAAFVTNRSQGSVTMFEWRRGDGPLFTVWASSGERSVTFDAPGGKLTVMDLMGNRSEVKATDGVVSLKVTPSPVYVFGGGALTLSRRLEAWLQQGSTKLGSPRVNLTLKNNGPTAIEGNALFSGPIQGEAKQTFKVAPGATTTLSVPAKTNLPTHERTSFSAECATSGGAVYLASAGLNFAQAIRVAKPPALDGTWAGWEADPPIVFGTQESQIFKGYTRPDVKYRGPDDVSGKFRLLWDEQFLYLGVEATDNSFFPQPERGMSGFMGDSIEFAFQPDNRLERQAPYWEYELYLPGGRPPYAASRRLPGPAEMVTHWQATVKPTGEKGNCNYQVAIPWRDVGVVRTPAAGNTISFALVLNDADEGQRMTGGRVRVRWFDGLDLAKNPEGFGDVTLVDP